MLWVSAAFCQLPATLYFEHLTRENGLPSNEVNCAIQDNQGFVWIGTLNGLVRYDGHDMKVFHYIPEDSTSIVDNTVIRLMQAKDSSIWIGSNDGYSIYHPSTGRFTNYSYHKLKAKGFRIRSATAFYQDDDLSVWIGTNDGLFKAAPDGRVMKEFRFNTTTDLNDRHTFTSIVNKIYRDPTNDSCLLVTTSGGPLQFDKIKGTVVNDFGCIDVGIPGLWTIVTEKSGAFYGGGWNLPGILYISPDRKHSRWIRKKGISFFTCTSMIPLNDREILLELDSHLAILDKNTGTFRTLSSNSLAEKSLLPNITGIVPLNHGKDLWILSGNGVNILNRKFRSFQSYPFHMEYNWITDFLRDRKHGTLYAGGYNSTGLFALDEKTNVWKVIPPEKHQGKGGLSITALFMDTEGVLWVSTRTGLMFLKPGDRALRLYRDLGGQYFHVNDSVVYYALEDHAGYLWIGTRFDGVFRITPDRRHIEYFGNVPGYQSGPGSGDHYVTITEDRFHKIWFGCREGVSIYDPDQKKFLNFLLDSLYRHGLRKSWINGIATDTMGRMWLALNGEGLVRVTENPPGKYHFKLFHTGNGLMDPNIGWISRDPDGNLWIINSGILFFNPYKESFRYFDQRNGLHENPGWASKLYIDEEGFLYNAINQEYEKNNIHDLDYYSRQEARLHLESISVNDKVRQIPFSSEKPDPMILAANENNLTFRYTAICFDGVEHLRYQYFLEGFDVGWSQPGSALEARYTNLPAGTYHFHVRAFLDGISMHQDKTLVFKIRSYIWKTWWFILTFFILAILAVYGLYRYRIRQLLKLERLRIRIASDLHDDVSSTLSSISILSTILTRKAKDPQSIEMLGEISGNARGMLERIDDIIWVVNPKNDRFQDLGLRIREYAIPLFEMKDIHFGIDFPASLSEVKLPMEVRRNIYLIAKEAVNNLVKYAGCTQASVIFRHEHSTLGMEINDNGKGFDTHATSTRNGVRNMRLRAEKIGAVLSITSFPEQGTRIVFSIKLI